MRRLSHHRICLWLGLFWMLSLAIAGSVAFRLTALQVIEAPTGDGDSPIERLLAMYAPYLGTVLAYYFATSHMLDRERTGTRGSAIIAFGASLAWNAVVLFPLISVAAGYTSNFWSALSEAESYGGKAAWLVAPALGYYFSTERQNDNDQTGATRKV